MCKESPPSRKLNESIDEMNPFKFQISKVKARENDRKVKNFRDRKKFSLKA